MVLLILSPSCIHCSIKHPKGEAIHDHLGTSANMVRVFTTTQQLLCSWSSGCAALVRFASFKVWDAAITPLGVLATHRHVEHISRSRVDRSSELHGHSQRSWGECRGQRSWPRRSTRRVCLHSDAERGLLRRLHWQARSLARSGGACCGPLERKLRQCCRQYAWSRRHVGRGSRCRVRCSQNTRFSWGVINIFSLFMFHIYHETEYARFFVRFRSGPPAGRVVCVSGNIAQHSAAV